MFALQLSYRLSDPIQPAEIQTAFRDRFGELQWGGVDDLMKAGADWPDAVADATLELDSGVSPRGFPASVQLLVFPRISDLPVMFPTKLAILRWLSAQFECRVICNARSFCAEKHRYDRLETFLCQGGRFYVGKVEFGREDREAAKPDGGWAPMDDTPDCELNSRGQLLDETRVVAEHKIWRERWTPPPPPEPKFHPPQPPNWDFDFDDFPFDAPADKDWEKEWEADPYLKKLSEWEDGFGTTGSKQLLRDGVSLPPPDTLDDAALHAKLWQVIRGMAKNNIVLYQTNHLSDRELYTYLWEDWLNDDIMDMTGLIGGTTTVDLLGSGSEEDTWLHQKFYADARDRALWRSSFPEDDMPAHVDPPYDRDRLLPQRQW